MNYPLKTHGSRIVMNLEFSMLAKSNNKYNLTLTVIIKRIKIIIFP